MKPFKVRLLSIFLLANLLAAFPSSHVRAYSAIYVNRYAMGLNDGTSWKNAYTDLQSALGTASEGSEIWVAKGTYLPTTGYDRNATFLLKNSVRLYGGFSGTETSLGQRKPSVNVTTLSGNIGLKGSFDNSYHVVTSIDTHTILDGFTISYGNANGSALESSGGGLCIVSGSPTLRNIIFSNNLAVSGGGLGNYGSSPTLDNVAFNNNSANSGGGMFNSSSNPILTDVTFSSNSAPGGGGMFNIYSSPALTDVTFSSNSATDGSGGGMYNDSSSPALTNVTFNSNTANNGGGIHNFKSSPILTNVTFSSNSATIGSGGGMYNSSSNPILTNVTFSSNSANNGGGLYDFDGNSTLTGVTFSGNSAQRYGGGMDSRGSSNPTLTNVTFTFNSAGVHGGGMQIDYSATLTDVAFRGNIAGDRGGGLYSNGDAMLTNVTFDNNFAENGGGLLTRGSPTLTNVTFGGNAAQSNGGGMINDPGGIPTLTNVTFKNNSAGSKGGALFNFGELVLSNAILWSNRAPQGAQLQNGVKAAIINNSVVQDGCPDNSICTDIIKDDPLLGVLANYGGNTKTIPLEPGSSAIDTGDDSLCPATDQRGVPRPQGSRCDIGAYEAAAPGVGPGIYDDTHSAWSYTGTWTAYSGTGPYNNTMHYTETVGDKAELLFQGTAFTLTFTRNTNRGSIEVYVDNAYVTTINANSSVLDWQSTWSSPAFAAGDHTVRFIHAGGGTYIDIDAITILP